MNKIVKFILNVAIVISVASCGSGGGDKEQPKNSNIIPTVNAGPDQIVNSNEVVNLNGVASDEDGNIVSFLWEQIKGKKVNLQNYNTSKTSFTLPSFEEETELEFKLVVIDNSDAQTSDTVKIIVKKTVIPLTVDAGSNQIVEEGSEVQLIGSTNIDDNAHTYSWIQISGSPVTLNDNDKKITGFVAPAVSNTEVLEFKFTVSDNFNNSIEDTVLITINDINEPPTASAGESYFAISSETVELDASLSSDDNDISLLTYTWSQIDDSGLIIELNNSNKQKAKFIAPSVIVSTVLSFQVTVTDAEGLTDISTVNIAIKPLINSKINDTGLLRCAKEFDAEGKLLPNCQSSVGEDAQSGRDISSNYDQDGKAGFSFTKLDSNGDPVDKSSQSWSCVLDNVTGLVWEVKSSEKALHDPKHTYSWYDPDSSKNAGYPGLKNQGVCSIDSCDSYSYINMVNEQNFCGKNDWRLPTQTELLSIRDFGISAADNTPNIDTSFFPSTSFNLPFWTATSKVTPYPEQNLAIGIFFLPPPNFGDEYSLDNFIVETSKTKASHIRLVKNQ